MFHQPGQEICKLAKVGKRLLIKTAGEPHRPMAQDPQAGVSRPSQSQAQISGSL